MRPADIRTEWPRIKAGVARALDGDDDLPEEVYAACRAGRAFLHISDDLAVVLRWHDKASIVVWVAVALTDKPGSMIRNDEAIAAIAREAGAKRLLAYTNRKAFERALAPAWRRAFVVYERDV